MELYIHPPMRLHGVVLNLTTHRDNFTFFTLRKIEVYNMENRSLLTEEIHKGINKKKNKK
jgi:hypothetical protein